MTEVFENSLCSGISKSCHLRYYTTGDCIEIDDTSSRKITGCSKSTIDYIDYESRNCDSTLNKRNK